MALFLKNDYSNIRVLKIALYFSSLLIKLGLKKLVILIMRIGGFRILFSNQTLFLLLDVVLENYSSERVLDAHTICDLAMYNYIEVKKIHFGFLSCVFIKVYSQFMSISNRCVIWLQPSAIN